ncbi:hypothetical protein PENSPDRAFT_680618 [Peniophora sp. CONT]|nr:hypothetical protein PENSPDRAFT_680618 [Peniophora sp. CONT]
MELTARSFSLSRFLAPPSTSANTERAMRIEVIVDPSAIQTAAPSLAARVAPAAAPAAAPAPAANGARRTGSAPRGRGGRGGRGGRRNERPKKTAEDLDAEMEDYTQTNNAPAAAAAPAAAPAAAAAT